MRTAKTLIEELRLSPHPEGGWYREVWRAPAEEGERSQASAIYFLLEGHQQSHWHKVDAAEIWLWQRHMRGEYRRGVVKASGAGS